MSDIEKVPEKAPVIKPAREDRNVGNYINMEDAEKMLVYANWAVEKKVAPKGMDTPQYFMCLQAGIDLKMNLMQVNSSLCIINGRVSVYGPEVIARARRAGYILTPLEETKELAKVQIEIEGRAPYITEFTKEDADIAGLTSGDRAAVWKKYPKDLLFWKAAARAIRKYAPEVLGGYDVAEDVRETEVKEPAKTIKRPDLTLLETPIVPHLKELMGEEEGVVENGEKEKTLWGVPVVEDNKVPEIKIEGEQAELPA